MREGESSDSIPFSGDGGGVAWGGGMGDGKGGGDGGWGGRRGGVAWGGVAWVEGGGEVP